MCHWGLPTSTRLNARCVSMCLHVFPQKVNENTNEHMVNNGYIGYNSSKYIWRIDWDLKYLHVSIQPCKRKTCHAIDLVFTFLMNCQPYLLQTIPCTASLIFTVSFRFLVVSGEFCWTAELQEELNQHLSWDVLGILDISRSSKGSTKGSTIEEVYSRFTWLKTWIQLGFLDCVK